MERIYCLLIGYVFGLFMTGYVVGKANGIDIRTKGSGNLGATNALRVLGKKAGLLVFAGDLIKLWLACILTIHLFNHGIYHDERGILILLYTGFGVTLGHNYPFYLKFRGGKGITVTGALLLILDWRLVLIAAVTFLIATAVTRYVSVGSICVETGFFLEWLIMGHLGLLSVFGAAFAESSVIVLLIWALALFRHRSNIRRLIHGTENRLSFGSHAADH